ncbi:MAG: ABC transporter ATP-binding protein [Candidatus Hodarchaeales archaeon]|jgi:ABC-2 type transport system ATP-binding protein
MTSDTVLQINKNKNKILSEVTTISGNNQILIQTKELSKNFGNKGEIKAVDKLDLTIYEGETFGLLGPNGAGKTTTVRLLNGILTPSSGTATIQGFDILKEKNKVKSITGLLAESPGLYDKLSAYEFLEFMGSLYDVPNKVLKERIEELLKLLSLSERKNHLLEGFSAGMKQKILIAVALIHDPPILFFDEPTAMLDPRAAFTIKELIKGLAKQAGKTVMICSHLMPLVEELCDRIGIIYDGKLVAIGTVEEILKLADTTTLEDAFIVLTGGHAEKELLAWRNGS